VKRKPGRPPGSKNKKPAQSAKAAPAKAVPATPAKAAKAVKAVKSSAPKSVSSGSPSNDIVEYRRLVIKLGLARATELLGLVRRQLDSLIAGE
jgi:hypothetical protein